MNNALIKKVNELPDQEKLDLFQIEELEPRLEMGGWAGDGSCDGSCNGSCDSCCGGSCTNNTCNTECADFGCCADLVCGAGPVPIDASEDGDNCFY